jgi:glycosyltransferase involved in cell wall biosynthesis
MRILYIISAPSAGGIEAYIRDLSKELISDGNCVHIGFLERAEDTGASVLFQKEYLQDLDRSGVKYFFIGSRARKLPWLGVSRVLNYVRKHRIDLYHSHLTYGIVFGALVRVPRIYTHHSVEPRMHRVLYSLVSPFVDQFVGISRACKAALVAQTGRDVLTIFNAVDLRKFAVSRSKSRIFEGKIRCIAVGRICSEKNYGLLVDAISRVPAEVRSRLRVDIVGSGGADATNALERRIRKMGLERTIRLLGTRNDVPDLLASSQLFVMSSSSEGLPIALIEAAVSGLPCIVTGVGGCGEVIETCKNGIVVEPNNAKALATAIESTIRDPEELAKFSVNAFSRSDVFSIRSSSTSHASMYRQLMQPNRGEVINE